MQKDKPTILLHSCCAPCLTAVYEILSPDYEVTVFWYNPNIWPEKEHHKRYEELIRYCKIINAEVLQGDYDYKEEQQYYLDQIKGLENEPEKGKRCLICYRLRLEATAYVAKMKNFEYFASELSISPHKDSLALNKIGLEVSEQVGIKYLKNDFKKAGGFKRSVELSKKYNIYRQDYCGCKLPRILYTD